MAVSVLPKPRRRPALRLALALALALVARHAAAQGSVERIAAVVNNDVITTQDLFVFEILGEDAQGNILGRHRSTGVGRPRFWERARYYGEEQRLAAALDAAETAIPENRT